jgi:hypothetical protein
VGQKSIAVAERALRNFEIAPGYRDYSPDHGFSVQAHLALRCIVDVRQETNVVHG